MYGSSSKQSKPARNRASQSQTKSDKVYCVIGYIEDGIEKKSVVPHHWHDCSANNLIYPNRKVAECLAKWTSPKPDWNSYTVTKVLKEFGTKMECDAFLRNHVDSSLTTDDDKTVTSTPSPKKIRVESPVIKTKSAKRRLKSSFSEAVMQKDVSRQPSPIFMSSPLTQKRVPTNTTIEELEEVEYLETVKTNVKPAAGRKGGRPFGDGGQSFKLLENKAFQYQVLMRLSNIEQCIEEQNQSIEMLGRRVEPESSAHNFKLIETYEEFVEFDEKLNDDSYYRLTLSRLQNFGVIRDDIKKSLRIILGYTLALPVQRMFNRDGGIRIKEMPGKIKKKSLVKTNFYRCIRDALSTQGFTILGVFEAIGTVLRQVKKEPKADS